MEPNKTEALTRLGARLREARRARKLTQEAVAQPEFTKSYISAIERGRARPSLPPTRRRHGPAPPARPDGAASGRRG